MTLPILLLFLLSFVSSGEEQRPWQVPEAQFRLTVISPRFDQACNVDLRRIVLPELPQNGVQVFDDSGKAVAFQLHDNLSLSIAPAPNAKSFDIYFGFQTPQKFDRWNPQAGTAPPSQRLKMNYYGGANRPCTPEEYLANREIAIERHARGVYKNVLFLSLVKDTGVEPPRWPPRFSQYYKSRQDQYKRLITKKKKQWIDASLAIYGVPYYERVRRYNLSHKQHTKNNFNYFFREMKKIDALTRQARKDMVDGAEKDLLSVVNWKNPQEFVATEVQLMIRPPDTREHFTAYFSGFLNVPNDGDYEFELFTNSLTIMRIDGNIVAERRNANGSQVPATTTVTIPLKKGSTFFELFYRLNSGHSRMIAKMRSPLDQDFQLLSAAENFTPARAAYPIELVNRDDVHFPLIMRRNHDLMYTDKRSYTPIESFDFLTLPETLEWSFGGKPFRPIDELSPTVIPGDTPESRLAFRQIGHPETKLEVFNSGYRKDMVSLRPDLQLKLWSAPIMYDDEELTFLVESISRLPLEIEAFLNIKIDGKPQELRRVRLPAKPDERFNRAAANIYRKDTVSLPPPLNSEKTIEVKLSVEKFQFDRKLLRVLPIASDNLAEKADADNIVLVLKRPKLSDVRTWELPRKIGNELAPYNKLLVIGEPLAGLGKAADETLKTKENQSIELVSFAGSETPLQTDLLKLLDRIGNSDADRVALILPCLYHTGTLEPYLRERYIAALLGKLRSNSAFHAIYLIPGPVHPGEEELSDRFMSSLRRLAREYDAILFEPTLVPKPSGVEHSFHTLEEFNPLLQNLRQKL
jgi:hypothetical protein